LYEGRPILKEIQVVIGIGLVNKGFKVIQCHASEIRYSKKDFFGIISEFSITGTKINLILEYKSMKLIWATFTKGVRLFDDSEFLLRAGIGLLGNGK